MITRGLDWLKSWLKDIASTNLTIVTGLTLGIVYVIWALAAATWGTPIDENTLDTVGLFIAANITAGATQFAVKRRTDDAYMAAKNGNAPMRATQEMRVPGGPNAAP
jgi:hypothetical protein